MLKNILNILLIFVVGCTSLQERIEKEVSSINFSDGVDSREASIVAQRELLNRKLEKEFEVLQPKVFDFKGIRAWLAKSEYQDFDKQLMNARDQQQYRESWFVLFPPPPFNSFSHFLIAVDKKAGDICLTHTFDPWASLNNIASMIADPASFIQAVYGATPLIAAVNYYQEKREWPADFIDVKNYFAKKDYDQDVWQNFFDVKFYKDSQNRPIVEYKDREKKLKKFIILSSDFKQKTHQVMDDTSNSALDFRMKISIKFDEQDKVLVDLVNYSIENEHIDEKVNSIIDRP